jgi:hypothetical protein
MGPLARARLPKRGRSVLQNGRDRIPTGRRQGRIAAIRGRPRVTDGVSRARDPRVDRVKAGVLIAARALLGRERARYWIGA